MASKYKAKKQEVNGIVFDSRKEARRYSELLLLERTGHISNLQMQVPFELVPKQKGERAVKYMADFVYEKDGERVVEDVKGYRKGAAYSMFVVKRKLMLWVHNIKVVEI